MQKYAITVFFKLVEPVKLLNFNIHWILNIHLHPQCGCSPHQECVSLCTAYVQEQYMKNNWQHMRRNKIENKATVPQHRFISSYLLLLRSAEDASQWYLFCSAAFAKGQGNAFHVSFSSLCLWQRVCGPPRERAWGPSDELRALRSLLHTCATSAGGHSEAVNKSNTRATMSPIVFPLKRLVLWCCMLVLCVARNRAHALPGAWPRSRIDVIMHDSLSFWKPCVLKGKNGHLQPPSSDAAPTKGMVRSDLTLCSLQPIAPEKNKATLHQNMPFTLFIKVCDANFEWDIETQDAMIFMVATLHRMKGLVHIILKIWIYFEIPSSG